MSRTPTPWHKEDGRPKVRNLRDELIADCGNFHIGSLEKRNANAAFIVEACNAHEWLKRERDALKKALDCILAEAGQLCGGEVTQLSGGATHVANKALTLCEERGKG